MCLLYQKGLKQRTLLEEDIVEKRLRNTAIGVLFWAVPLS